METLAKIVSPEPGPNFGRVGRRRPAAIFAFLFILISTSCTQLNKPEPEPYFAESPPPKVQELRWNNGKMQKSFDPALAAAPPETDIVRALYEGLTETDPATLQEIPGVAESWTSSEDSRIWTFRLRRDAEWSNGKPVTADDFVRAWKRLIKLGEKTAHRDLLSNIAGVPNPASHGSTSSEAEQFLDANSNQAPANLPAQQRFERLPANANVRPDTRSATGNSNTAWPAAPVESLGIVAEDQHTLRVSLIHPDPDFPKLVAHPIFRPIFSNGEEFIGKELNPTIVTNGPFSLSEIGQQTVLLERSKNYWNRGKIVLERVRIVASESPELALAAYRAGELDAITNADLSPLVLKLLSPYEDFRKTTHSALNLYEVNTARKPFSDRRVREALSNAIERERLTEGEMEGLTRPALSFLAFRTSTKAKLTQDKEKAKDLLDEAGFPDGQGFPVIQLVINRNETQQKVARSVARMWKQNLNVDTEIVVKEASDLELARKAGEFDLVRRGVVFPTADEAVNFMEVFDYPSPPAAMPAASASPEIKPSLSTPEMIQPGAQLPSGKAETLSPEVAPTRILTEDEALYQLRAIPIYFPTSFSLVKPYVAGFDMNSLDVLNLANVTINSEWRPKARQ